MRRAVLLALAAGPVLGALAFYAVVRGIEAPAAVPAAGRVYVPWHQSTRLTALEVTKTAPDTVEVLTRRDAKTGTTFILRRIDCAAREFQYLGEGPTEQQARERKAADTRKNPISDGTISLYVAKYACPGWKDG